MSEDPFDFDYSDIVEAELAAQGVAAIVPPESSSWPLDDQFLKRSEELNRKPYRGAQSVSVIDQRRGPWSGSNQLGNDLAFLPSTNNEQTILKLDEWGMPQVWSFLLSLDLPLDEVSIFNVIAKVRAGIGGTVDEFELDWNRGTSFNVPANAINIIAAYDTSAGVIIPDNVRLRVLAARRPLHGTSPTRTIASIIQAGTSEQQIIPKYAKYVSLIDKAGSANPFAATTNYIFTYSPIAGGNAGAFAGTQIGPIWSNRIPIPGGAKGLHITNTGAAAISISGIYHLAL